MAKKLFSLIHSCLKENRNKLHLAVRQRAKFEDWLKIELFYSIWQKLLHGNQDSEIEIERPYPKNKQLRCDIFFATPQKRHVYLELKIINTSYDCDSYLIPKKAKPITKNVQSVIEASERLRKFTNKKDEKIVAFVVYPLCREKLGNWQKHESKINEQGFLKKIRHQDLKLFSNDKRIFMRFYLYQVFTKNQKY